MQNLIRIRSKEAPPLVGRVKPAGPGAGDHHVIIKCKKHPKHMQSPGVCSLCLNEKLSQLSTSSSRSSNKHSSAITGLSSSSSSSLSSYSCSSTCSSCASPMHRYRYTDHRGAALLFSGKKNALLTKSRSLAFVPRMRTTNKAGGDGNKKGRFWSNFLRPRRNKRVEEGFMFSRTMRERPH
ncbi:hypothetical protein Tsubulata_016336 [Turnera subulata]|uniref:Uncharacterized protein n=1 Tax=Turnera subulata TaxID=218843 RepID=A0A9Q0G5E6_9ROSI|nr:hypothetical protein Tsubulata_016336 [Turnera subulata]